MRVRIDIKGWVKKNKVFGILIFLSIIFLIYLLSPQAMVFQIVDSKGTIRWMQKVKGGTTFEIYSIHSVTNTPLVELLEIKEEGGFITTAVRYKDQGGAGLPEFNYSGEIFAVEEDGYVISGLNRHYQQLTSWVDKAYDNTIRLDGKEVKLFELVADKPFVLLRIENMSLIDYYLKQHIISNNRKEISNE